MPKELPPKVDHLKGCPDDHDTDDYVLVETESIVVEGQDVPRGGVIACPVKGCEGVGTWSGPFSVDWEPDLSEAGLDAFRQYIQERFGV